MLTTVGLCFNPNTHIESGDAAVCMLAWPNFIHCVCNESAGSSDMGFNNYGDRK